MLVLTLAGLIGLVAVQSGDARPDGREFDDCAGAGWCPRMVIVPAGDFLMGAVEDDAAAWRDERPQRRVQVDRFAAGKFEITFDQWEACVRGGGCASDRSPDDRGWGRGTRPVFGLSWNAAQEYVAWLSAATGRSYRLLTEEEWEYAARAGSSGRWSWGDDPNRACDFANLLDRTGAAVTTANCRDGFVRRTAPAGSFHPNALGLYDMHGNVWEWVQDCYTPDHAGPGAGAQAQTTGPCAERVRRGGGWFSLPSALRVSNRERGAPAIPDLYTGLRVARSLDPD